MLHRYLPVTHSLTHSLTHCLPSFSLRPSVPPSLPPSFTHPPIYSLITRSLTYSLTRFLSCFWFRVQSDRVALHTITHHETRYVHQPRPRTGVCERGGTGRRFVDNVFAMKIWLIYRNPNMRRVTGWVREVMSLRLFGLVILQLKTVKHFTTRLQHNVTQTRAK